MCIRDREWGVMVVHDGQVAVEVRHVTRLITVNDILAEHVSLDVSCLDRIYLTATCPRCRCPGRSCSSCSTADSRSRLRRWWRRWAHTKQRGPDSLRSG